MHSTQNAESITWENKLKGKKIARMRKGNTEKDTLGFLKEGLGVYSSRSPFFRIHPSSLLF